MKKFIKFLSSIKFAIVLIVCLIPISIIYSHSKSSRFLLLIILVLFFINLLLCTCKRIYKQIKGVIKINPGPDIIHIGILTLLVSLFLSSLYSFESLKRLSIGDVIGFKGNEIEVLEIYNRDFQTRLKISNNKSIENDVLIEVNKPYRKESAAIYQNQLIEIKYCVLKSKLSGKEYYLLEGDHFKIGENNFEIENIKEDLIEVKESNTKREVKVGEDILNFTLENINYEVQTVLHLKYEPFYYFTYVSLILVLIGFILTWFQKGRINVR